MNQQNRLKVQEQIKDRYFGRTKTDFTWMGDRTCKVDFSDLDIVFCAEDFFKLSEIFGTKEIELHYESEIPGYSEFTPGESARFGLFVKNHTVDNP